MLLCEMQNCEMIMCETNCEMNMRNYEYFTKILQNTDIKESNISENGLINLSDKLEDFCKFSLMNCRMGIMLTLCLQTCFLLPSNGHGDNFFIYLDLARVFFIVSV